VFQFIADQHGRLDGVIVLPATPNVERGHTLGMAEDGEVEAFVRDEDGRAGGLRQRTGLRPARGARRGRRGAGRSRSSPTPTTGTATT
jgi:hypothetical protein